MKKILVILLSFLMIFSMVGCGDKTKKDDKHIEKLTVSFVPSKDADVIMQAASGNEELGYRSLAQIIIDGLAARGYTVDEVEVSVGTSYAAVGEGMVSGTIDIGLIPASTYVLYSDGVELLVEALRYGVAGEDGVVIDPALGIDPWNAGKTTNAEGMATGYASLIYVNVTTEIGQNLYEKAQAKSLTWEDVNAATWFVCSSTSSAGYVYPSLWINNTFGEGAGNEKRTVVNLQNVIPDGSYANMMESLLTGGCDVTVGYADVRKDAASTTAFEAAYPELAAEGKTVWDIIKVIAVSDYIMNDTVSVTKKNPKMTAELIKALQEVFIELGNTEEGRAAVKPYSHMGYVVGKDSDYDSTRQANALFQK
ncbi:MAG TPA: PhnD/SsuA/transferrin family substrate-binding protein [Erysipelotrichaceae bacterium]|jgi:phosphonate transport system substrate-binding protein|nr:PhnD/SsuA/transferrin family substrate-binding protein [Erysipelotrichia bacterium]HPX33422.1 PhnD/SsuA/transferrin family substrate-binding protein [Erysipelotrichaceae bacterium]HQA85765.1 PhnD/SsuA/transferrin family substrate-binding protein [Erysipelotrichaceae bacterium]